MKTCKAACILHIKTCKAAYFHIGRANFIRQYLTEDTTKTPASCPDQTTAIPYGSGIRQSLDHSAGKLILKSCRVQHSKPLLKQLQWLSIKQKTNILSDHHWHCSYFPYKFPIIINLIIIHTNAHWIFFPHSISNYKDVVYKGGVHVTCHESYCRQLRSLLLCLCDIFQALINTFSVGNWIIISLPQTKTPGPDFANRNAENNTPGRMWSQRQLWSQLSFLLTLVFISQRSRGPTVRYRRQTSENPDLSKALCSKPLCSSKCSFALFFLPWIQTC